MPYNSKSKNNLKPNVFSSENQPDKVGRKPSRFKSILLKLEDVGETISYEDYLKIIKLLLTLSPNEVKKLAKDKSTPLAVIAIASAISGDIENKQMSNIEKMLDRVFGKVVDKIDIKTNSNKELTDAQINELIEKL